MSRYTITNTAFGEMKVTYTPDGQIIRSVCKCCHRETEQLADVGANAFQVARPEHEPTCKFHPAYQAPTLPTRERGPRAARIEAVRVDRQSVTRTEALIAAGLLIAGLIAGGLIW